MVEMGIRAEVDTVDPDVMISWKRSGPLMDINDSTCLDWSIPIMKMKGKKKYDTICYRFLLKDNDISYSYGSAAKLVLYFIDLIDVHRLPRRNKSFLYSILDWTVGLVYLDLITGRTRIFVSN